MAVNYKSYTLTEKGFSLIKKFAVKPDSDRGTLESLFITQITDEIIRITATNGTVLFTALFDLASVLKVLKAESVRGGVLSDKGLYTFEPTKDLKLAPLNKIKSSDSYPDWEKGVPQDLELVKENRTGYFDIDTLKICHNAKKEIFSQKQSGFFPQYRTAGDEEGLRAWIWFPINSDHESFILIMPLRKYDEGKFLERPTLTFNSGSVIDSGKLSGLKKPAAKKPAAKKPAAEKNLIPVKAGKIEISKAQYDRFNSILKRGGKMVMPNGEQLQGIKTGNTIRFRLGVKFASRATVENAFCGGIDLVKYTKKKGW